MPGKIMQLTRVCGSTTLMLVLASASCTAFVPPTVFHSQSFQHLIHNGIGRFGQSDSAVDVLVQSKAPLERRLRVPHRRLCTRTRIILTQDLESKSHSAYLHTPDPEVEIDTLKKKPVRQYRMVSTSEKERKIQKKKKRQPTQRPSIYTAPAKQQPEWILQFSAAQRQIDDLKRLIQTSLDEPLVECAGAALIIVSSILVAITTLPNLPQGLQAPMETVQDILAYLFLAEFLTRWLSWTEKQGPFLTQPLNLVDVVVVVLPLLLPMLLPDANFAASGLLTLRLLRVLRFQRILKDEMTFSKFVNAVRLSPSNRSFIVQEYELQLARVVLSIFTLLSVAAGLIYTTEHVVNPAIDDYFTALYFTLTTLTTVGFGDITPMTWEGKLVVSGSILAGITIIPAQAAALVEALLQRTEEQQKREQQQQQQTSRILESTVAQQGTMGSDNNMEGGAVATLEAARKCSTCKVGLHLSHATYCYNCASPLEQADKATLVLPDHQA